MEENLRNFVKKSLKNAKTVDDRGKSSYKAYRRIS